MPNHDNRFPKLFFDGKFWQAILIYVKFGEVLRLPTPTKHNFHIFSTDTLYDDAALLCGLRRRIVGEEGKRKFRFLEGIAV